jgi:hypothetical protein
MFTPCAIPHGFAVTGVGPGRIIILGSPGGFDQIVTAAEESAPPLAEPPARSSRLTKLAATRGIQILPRPRPTTKV